MGQRARISMTTPTRRAAGRIALAEPVLHPWLLALRPSPLTLFLGMPVAHARRVMLGEAWVVLDAGDAPLRAGDVLLDGPRRALSSRHAGLTTATFSAALEARWKTVSAPDPNASRARALRQARWMRALGPLPATLLIDALPIAAGEGRASLFRALQRANASLAEAPTDLARRSLARAVHALWNARLTRLATPPEASPSGAAVQIDSVVPDPSLDATRCGLPVDVLGALLGRRVFDHLVVSGRARDLYDAIDLAEAEPAARRDALDALCETHPVLLVRTSPSSARHVVALTPTVCDGDGLRVHPSRMEHFMRDDLEPAAVHVLMPASARARREARRLVRDDARAPSAEAFAREGLSLGIDDLAAPPTREALIARTRAAVTDVENQYDEGLLTHRERSLKVIDLWAATGDEVQRDVMTALRTPHAEAPPTLLARMVLAGGGLASHELRTLVAMRGLVSDASGEIFEQPVVHSLREGVTAHEFARTTFGARSGQSVRQRHDALGDGVLRGLARLLATTRVLDADCGSTQGIALTACETLGALGRRALGRTPLGDVRDPRSGEVIASGGRAIDAASAARMDAAGVDEITVRSPLGCLTRGGVCRLCMGGAEVDAPHAGLGAALAVGDAARKVFGVRLLRVGC